MIYTITCNPSIDYIVSIDQFQTGKTNRTTAEQMLPGGKGINVSTVLNNLGIESVALGFTGGFTGRELAEMVQSRGLTSRFIQLKEGCTRINVKLKDIDGTEINGMGPVVDKAAVECLMQQLQELQAGDMVVLSGSVPKGLDENFYGDIMSRLSGKGIVFVVDATKGLLLNTLSHHPFLIKPNNHELEEIFGVTLKTRESVIPYAQKLRQMGAENVLVSLAGEGAVLVDGEDNVHMLPAPKGRLVNAVGAGDSMVAGFIAGWSENGDISHAFRLAVAAGSASAFSEGLATEREIRAIYN